MRLTTSYGYIDDGAGVAAAVNWKYPADHRVPWDAINAALGAHYDLCSAGKGDPPYLYIVREGPQQVGIFVADISNVRADGTTDAVDLEEQVNGQTVGLQIFNSIMEEEAQFPQPTPWVPRDWGVQTAWREDQGLAAIRWKLPHGLVFPADVLNKLLYGMYTDDDGYYPYFYPVFDPTDSSGTTPQIGVLLSTLRDESAGAVEFAHQVNRDFQGLMSIPEGETYLPWQQKEFDVA